jgi:hypothetical protein
MTKAIIAAAVLAAISTSAQAIGSACGFSPAPLSAHAWTWLDADRDGYLTRQEAVAGGLPAITELEAVDENHDGILTFAESRASLLWFDPETGESRG